MVKLAAIGDTAANLLVHGSTADIYTRKEFKILLVEKRSANAARLVNQPFHIYVGQKLKLLIEFCLQWNIKRASGRYDKAIIKNSTAQGHVYIARINAEIIAGVLLHKVSVINGPADDHFQFVVLKYLRQDGAKLFI